MSIRFSCSKVYVLHTRPFRETSLLVEIWSAEYGRQTLVAKGAKRARGNSAWLQPFLPQSMVWSGRHELKTLCSVEPTGAPQVLMGTAMVCGLYLNELLMRLLAKADPNPELQQAYREALAGLAHTDCFDKVLRRFEKRLLEALGYGILCQEDQFGAAIMAAQAYDYSPQQGPLPTHKDAACMKGAVRVTGESLLLLATEDFTALSQPPHRQIIKRLMRLLINDLLDGRPLHTRQLLEQSTVSQ